MNTAERLPAVRKLCEIPTPYDWTGENDSLFVQAMREICQWHIEQSPAYAARCAQFDFRPEQLRSVEDCTSIPYFLATVFKYHEILSIPRGFCSKKDPASPSPASSRTSMVSPWTRRTPWGMSLRYSTSNVRSGTGSPPQGNRPGRADRGGRGPERARPHSRRARGGF